MRGGHLSVVNMLDFIDYQCYIIDKEEKCMIFFSVIIDVDLYLHLLNPDVVYIGILSITNETCGILKVIFGI